MTRNSPRNAIIVGGGTGIGRAVAEGLISRDVAVAICGRRETVLLETARALEAEHPGAQVQYRAGDLSSERVATLVVDSLVDAMGSVDILVCSAGTFETRPFLESNEQSWARTLSTTFWASLFPALAVTRHMSSSNQGGRVVLISSVSSVLSEEGTADYCAAKAAVSSLARSMAVDLARDGVRVNAISPGWIQTELVDEFLNSAPPEALRKLNPVGRVGQPHEVANLVAYLALDAPDYLTGASIFLDGGQTAMAPLPG
jgi:NAD(P)-dependent dehydrogenase (short-subunit alcohol dehydrogenase family)